MSDSAKETLEQVLADTEPFLKSLREADDIVEWLTILADDNDRVELAAGYDPPGKRNRIREAAKEIKRLRELLHMARCSTDPYWAIHLLQEA